MTWNRSQLMNFVSKFLGTVRFENDQIAKIMGYGDYQLRNAIISRVYYVEGLRHNLFSVGQFCDADLEVAFRKNTCFIRNLESVDLLSGSKDTNLCIISLDNMLKTSSICLLSKASKTKSWLWHRRITPTKIVHLNETTSISVETSKPEIKVYSRIPKQVKSVGSSKKAKIVQSKIANNSEPTHLWGSNAIDVPSSSSLINDRLSRLFSVRFENDQIAKIMGYGDYQILRSNDESPDVIIKCIKNIQVRLNATVRNVRTDKGIKFVDQTLCDFYENVSISHQTFVARTPQQNSVVESRNQNLVEASRTMLIFSKAPLFLWVEAINTACYTQNRSLIRIRYNKTPYELMHDKKPNLSFLHVFGSLCYSTNDGEDLGKLIAKADVGIFVSYAPAKKAFKIYNRRTRKIMKTIHVTFDELTALASKQFGSGPGLQLMTPVTSSSGLVTNPIPQQPCNTPNRDDWDCLFQPMFDEYFNPPTIVVFLVLVAVEPRAVDIADSSVSMSIDLDAPSTIIPSTQEQEHSRITKNTTFS
nr:hypothetical protein [Tanacetum cinerariifolium]